MFKKALSIDPEYTPAYAGLANAYNMRAQLKDFSKLIMSDSAMIFARRALEIDPDLAEGYKALGVIFSVKGEQRKAINAWLKAVELQPNHLWAMWNLCLNYLNHPIIQLDSAFIFANRMVAA